MTQEPASDPTGAHVHPQYLGIDDLTEEVLRGVTVDVRQQVLKAVNTYVKGQTSRALGDLRGEIDALKTIREEYQGVLGEMVLRIGDIEGRENITAAYVDEAIKAAINNLPEYATVADLQRLRTDLTNYVDSEFAKRDAAIAGVEQKASTAQTLANDAYGIATRAHAAANSAASAVTSLEGVVGELTSSVSGLSTDVGRLTRAGFITGQQLDARGYVTEANMDAAIRRHLNGEQHGGNVYVPVQPPNNGGNNNNQNDGRRRRFAGCLVPLGAAVIGAAAVLGAVYLMDRYGKPDIINGGSGSSGVSSEISQDFKGFGSGKPLYDMQLTSAVMSQADKNSIDASLPWDTIKYVKVSAVDSTLQVTYTDDRSSTSVLPTRAVEDLYKQLDKNSYHVLVLDSGAIRSLGEDGRNDLANILSGMGTLNADSNSQSGTVFDSNPGKADIQALVDNAQSIYIVRPDLPDASQFGAVALQVNSNEAGHPLGFHIQSTDVSKSVANYLRLEKLLGGN